MVYVVPEMQREFPQSQVVCGKGEGYLEGELVAWTISDSDLGTKLCVWGSKILAFSIVLLKGMRKIPELRLCRFFRAED